MNNSEETKDQPTKEDLILQAIAGLSKKLDEYDKRFESIDKRLEAIDKRFESIDKRFKSIDKRFDAVDAQMEAIRQGIVDNNIRFDRLEGNFHHLRADVTTMIEEVRHNRRVLV